MRIKTQGGCKAAGEVSCHKRLLSRSGFFTANFLQKWKVIKDTFLQLSLQIQVQKLSPLFTYLSSYALTPFILFADNS